MLVSFDSKSSKESDKGNIIGGTSGGNKIRKPSSKSMVKSSGQDVQAVNSTAVKIIENMDDFHKFRVTRRSKNGCLTCKIRKKKCNEAKPICSDCLRLNKECIWIDYEKMSEEEIRLLKEKVERDESSSKLRKRKSKSTSSSNKTLGTLSKPGVAESKTTTSPSSSRAQFSQQTQESSPHNGLNMFKMEKPVSPEFKTHFHERGIQITKVHSPSSPSPSEPLTNYELNQEFPIVSSSSSNNVMPNSPTISSLMNPIEPDVSKDDSPPPLDIDSCKGITEKSSFSPSAFISFLKDLSQCQYGNDENKISLVDESDEPVTEILASPNFPSMKENTLLDNCYQSPLNYHMLLSNLDTLFRPTPQYSPSLIPELNENISFLYDYYVEVLSQKMSIAPTSQNESNSYQKIFLPLAHQDKGVLYGILAWAGFDLGGKWADNGVKYVELALEHLNKSLLESINSNKQDRQSILIKLATLLILCGAEICKGDVKNWSVYLRWGWKILFSNGGILNFNQSREEHWLISNFAYHDLLASSSSERGTYFPSKDYDLIFKDYNGFSKGNLNPLLGVSKTLYKIIGDISTLSFDSKKTLNEFYKRDSLSETDIGISESPTSQESEKDLEDHESNISNHGQFNRLLQSVIEKSKALEIEIDNSKPDSDDLISLTDEELEWQLTLFEAFQISAKLFLRQSIMKCNPSMLEIQILTNDLIKCIDILLGSPVQASLVFPIFMAGIHCVTNHDRLLMKNRIDKFMELYGPWNVRRVKSLIEYVWHENSDGDKAVDWYIILKDLGWDINFA